MKTHSRNKLQKMLSDAGSHTVIDAFVDQVKNTFIELTNMFYGRDAEGKRLVQALDPIDYEPKEPFTNSTEY